MSGPSNNFIRESERQGLCAAVELHHRPSFAPHGRQQQPQWVHISSLLVLKLYSKGKSLLLLCSHLRRNKKWVHDLGSQSVGRVQSIVYILQHSTLILPVGREGVAVEVVASCDCCGREQEMFFLLQQYM